VKAFEIKLSWPKRADGIGVEATVASVKINVGSHNATAYRRSHKDYEEIEAPTYYLAEWIAENWWPLLWEPRKSDETSQSTNYSLRHNIVSAENGFALPSISFTPTGEHIEIFVSSRSARYSKARFYNKANVTASLGEIEGEFRQFIKETLDKMGAATKDTPLEAAWERLLETDRDKDQFLFCALIGSLGLSPYEPHPEIEKALDSVSDVISVRQLFDLCRGSTPENLVANAQEALQIGGALSRAKVIDLSKLIKIPAPSEQIHRQAYHSGYEAARKLKTHFAIKDSDLNGAKRIFQELNIDPDTKNYDSGSPSDSDLPIVGATSRQDDRGKLVIAAEASAQRNFAAGRGAYFFWTAGDEQCLITNAHTRDQQASRAFAAELLMPRSFLKSIATKDGRISSQEIYDLADKEDISANVIKWQARNHNFRIA
jgi:hypothetical protein